MSRKLDVPKRRSTFFAPDPSIAAQLLVVVGLTLLAIVIAVVFAVAL